MGGYYRTLTESDILRIRHLRETEGLTYEVISVRMGATESNVRMVCQGKTWKRKSTAPLAPDRSRGQAPLAKDAKDSKA